MSDAEKIDIKELVDVLKELDDKDLVLINNSAETLAARRALDKQEKAPA